MIARLADGHDGLVCGPLARKALRGILRAYDCSDETAALASRGSGGRSGPPATSRPSSPPQKRPRTTRRPSMPSRPRSMQSTVRASSGGWSGRRARARALDGARACLNRGAPVERPRRARGAGRGGRAVLQSRAPLRCGRRGSLSAAAGVLDLRRLRRGAAAAGARCAGGVVHIRRLRRGAAPQAASAAPGGILHLRRLRRGGPRASRRRRRLRTPPSSTSSTRHHRQAAPRRLRCFDEFDAAPQQRQAPPSMLDGFDAAPQRPAAPPVDARRLRRRAAAAAAGPDGRPRREDAPTEAASSGDDDTPRRRHLHGSARARWPWRPPRRGSRARGPARARSAATASRRASPR